jgi:RimJ/RimL family protein N-acetyltransferase
MNSMALLNIQQIRTKTNHDLSLKTIDLSEAETYLDFMKKITQTSDYLVTEPSEYEVSVDEKRKYLARLLDNPGAMAMGAYHNNKLVAVLNFERGYHKKTQHSGMLRLYVAKDWRGHGLAAQMLQSFMNWVEAQSVVNRIEIGIMSGNRAAISLFKKMQFREEGIRLKAFKQLNGSYNDEILLAYLVR